LGRMRLPCWSCGEKIMVDEREPAAGLAAAGWVLTKGETYCWRCVVQRGLKGAPATADDQSPIGVPEFLRRPVPQGLALGDPRTREGDPRIDAVALLPRAVHLRDAAAGTIRD
jgi:hypothetical protein